MRIEPFTRRCVCPERPVRVEDHTDECNAAYRTEFMQARENIRRQFYSRGETLN